MLLVWMLAVGAARAQISIPPSIPPAIPPAAPPVLALDDLGRGAVALDGPWQFHLGDNPLWARPGTDDATGHGGWETILATRPWGAQGHYAYTGVAWYRRPLRIAPAPGVQPDFLLLMPQVSDAYEVYWNGALIGRLGRLPPDASWPAFPSSHIFGFPGAGAGTLAIRVWKAPLGSDASGDQGGLFGPPLVGSRSAIAGSKALRDYAALRSDLYTAGLGYLGLVVGCMAFVLWLRRRERLLLWFAIFTAAPTLWVIVYSLGISIDAAFVGALNQPLWALENIALWFLLISLLQLESNRRLLRWAKALAILKISTDTLDGILCLAYFVAGWSTHLWIDWTDAVLTAISTVFGIFPLVIVVLGLRRKLDPARWAVALTAFLSQMIVVVIAASQQGQRFTHWTFSRILGSPLFTVEGTDFNAQTLTETALLVSIFYAVYRFSIESRRRQTVLEQEFKNARELQRVLIPETLPEVPGFAVTSAYRPAQEVGGDFFQIIPLETGPLESGPRDGESKLGGSTLVVLGDVSGKGLRAAMAVSLIVGAVRALADDYPQPSRLLAQLNRRLCGRMQGGFATCVIIRLSPGGDGALASAGHPAPFLNSRELELPGALPLGVSPAAAYPEFAFRLRAGDRLALYTDGLLEARSQAGELYGFARLEALFAARPEAAEAAEAAVRFGQEDDITVLTLTRRKTLEERPLAHAAAGP